MVFLALAGGEVNGDRAGDERQTQVAFPGSARGGITQNSYSGRTTRTSRHSSFVAIGCWAKRPSCVADNTGDLRPPHTTRVERAGSTVSLPRPRPGQEPQRKAGKV